MKYLLSILLLTVTATAQMWQGTLASYKVFPITNIFTFSVSAPASNNIPGPRLPFPITVLQVDANVIGGTGTNVTFGLEKWPKFSGEGRVNVLTNYPQVFTNGLQVLGPQMTTNRFLNPGEFLFLYVTNAAGGPSFFQLSITYSFDGVR